MKLHTSLFALSLPILIASCSKSSSEPIDGRVYTGKILKGACGQIAIQVTDGSTLGEMGWNDEGKTYNNVFAVANPCTWRPKGGTSETIRFRFVKSVSQDCAQCMMYVHVPDTKYHIVVEE